MRILITGISGQVGGALLSRFPDHVVIGADRGMLDLSRPDEIANVLDRVAPDLIINPAAYTAVDRAESDQATAFLVNGEAPGAIARWATARKVPLIHFSTDYVFDGSGERPWREDDRPNPLSVYGASKLAGEEAVRAAGGIFLIIRTSWVYAATGKNFLRTIARLACERSELRVVADQFGAPTSASLIADAVTKIVGRDLKSISSLWANAAGIVHLTASGTTSWHGFACAIAEGLKARGVVLSVERIQPIQTIEYPTPAKRPLNSRLDLSRLQRGFNIVLSEWSDALAPELDLLAEELRTPE
jgi:dTDP-4-dehydrorhamnose reductase